MMHPDMAVLVQARERAGNARADGSRSPTEFRQYFSTYAGLLHSACPADVKVHDEVVLAGNLAVPVRIYRPDSAPASAPVIMYMHGGGFVAGDLDSSDTSAWGLAHALGVLVVSVDYRLAPEHPYPAQLDDCWAVLQWLPQQAHRLGLDPLRIAVTGESAGATLSAALALKSRDRRGPQIACVGMVYPWVGLSCKNDADPPSYQEFSDSPSLSRANMQHYEQSYLQHERDYSDPLARLAIANVENLPAFWVHTGAMDPLRDDGRSFAAKLAMAGVEVSYREAAGMLHGFMRARLSGAAARREFDALCTFLGLQLQVPGRT